jgi:hypothetical protein
MCQCVNVRGHARRNLTLRYKKPRMSNGGIEETTCIIRPGIRWSMACQSDPIFLSNYKATSALYGTLYCGCFNLHLYNLFRRITVNHYRLNIADVRLRISFLGACASFWGIMCLCNFRDAHLTSAMYSCASDMAADLSSSFLVYIGYALFIPNDLLPSLTSLFISITTSAVSSPPFFHNFNYKATKL